jgi:diguanylate cyclase (GGDEF)-like protein
MTRKKKTDVIVLDADESRDDFYQKDLASQGYSVTLVRSLAQLKDTDIEGISGAVVATDTKDAASAVRVLRRSAAGLGIVTVSPALDDKLVDEMSRAGADVSLGIDSPAKAIAKALAVAEQARSARVKAVELQEELNGVRSQMETVGLVDPLSGAYNDRFLDMRLAEEIQRGRRYRRALSVVVLDVDDYKRYCEVNGQRLAEFLTRQIAALLRWGTRPSDCVCRTEMDKFAVLLPETPLSGAISVAEKIRRSLEDLRFPGRGEESITCSVGVAELTEGIESGDKLLDAAESALSEAKMRGKNTVRW